MKKIILTGSILLCTICMYAQTIPNELPTSMEEVKKTAENPQQAGKNAKNNIKKTAEERATMLTEQIKTVCGNLSADQETKIKAIFLNKATQVDAIRTSSDTKEEKKEAFKLIFAQSKDELKSVLTANQYDKVKEMIKVKKAARGNKK